MRYPSTLAYVFVLLLSGMIAGGCATAEEPFDEAAYLASVEAWRQARLDELREPEGWFSLAGLYWLAPGANTFGGAADNDVVFPEGAPDRLGTFYLEGDSVRLEAAPGADLQLDDASVAAATVWRRGGEAARMTHGSLLWFAIERDGQVGLRLKDLALPARSGFDGVEHYDVDAAWRLVARFEPYTPPETLAVPTILGTVSPTPSPGAVVFEAGGQTHRLDVTGEPGDSTFFIIFADATNGKATYGAGRYLWIDAPGDDGQAVVDFNRSYNPPCVFTPYATCPFPPRQNRLALAVEAGEKTWGK